MQFKPEFIGKIIDGSKCQTRRLVKEGEMASSDTYLQGDKLKNLKGKKPILGIEEVLTAKRKVRWQVGKTYSVTPGRGKRTVRYCSKCSIEQFYQTPGGVSIVESICDILHHPIIELKIKILSIEKQKLLDITEEDAKKEGFLDKIEFLIKFSEINKAKNFEFSKKNILFPDYYIKDIKPNKVGEEWKTNWNPEIWRILFSRVD